METISCNNAGTTPYECHNTGARSTNRSLRLLMSNKAFSLVSGSCKLATRCSIFNAWLFDEALLVFEVVLVCCCVCAACAAAIIIARVRIVQNRLETFLSLSALNAFRILNLEQISIVCESGIFLETQKAVSHDSFTPKEVIRVFVFVSFSSVAVVVVVVVAERCSRLSFTCDGEITFLGKRRERIFLKRKREFVVFSVARCFCRCLTKNGGGV